MGAEQLRFLMDLNYQLAGRGHDQGPGLFFPLRQAFGLQQPVEKGDQESRRLAGSRLGLGGNVLSFQGDGQDLLLDRRAVLEAGVLNAL